jgi:hypothetical protein
VVSNLAELLVHDVEVVVISVFSLTASTTSRYASRSTRSFARTRERRLSPFAGLRVVRSAAARLSACCSRRSIPNSSERIGSSRADSALDTPTLALMSVRVLSAEGSVGTRLHGEE